MEQASLSLILQAVSTFVAVGIFVGYSRTQFGNLKDQIQELKDTQVHIQKLFERMAVVEKCVEHNARELEDLRRVVDRRSLQ